MLPILGKTYYVLAMTLYLVLNSIWNRQFSKSYLQKKKIKMLVGHLFRPASAALAFAFFSLFPGCVYVRT